MSSCTALSRDMNAFISACLQTPQVFVQESEPGICALNWLKQVCVPSSSAPALGFYPHIRNLHRDDGSCLCRGDILSLPVTWRANSSICGTSTSCTPPGSAASCGTPQHPAASCWIPSCPSTACCPSLEQNSLPLSGCAGAGERCCLPNQPSLAHLEMAAKCESSGLFSCSLRLNVCPGVIQCRETAHSSASVEMCLLFGYKGLQRGMLSAKMPRFMEPHVYQGDEKKENTLLKLSSIVASFFLF